EPYDEGMLPRYLAFALQQSTRLRRRLALALLALAGGAGIIGKELAALLVEDVHADGSRLLIEVHGRFARVVPMRAMFVDAFRELIGRSEPDEYVIGRDGSRAP